MVLLLPDGEADSHRRPSPLSYALQLPLARTLARAGQDDGLAAHVVHYRCRGWNATDAQLAADAEWAAPRNHRPSLPGSVVGSSS